MTAKNNDQTKKRNKGHRFVGVSQVVEGSVYKVWYCGSKTELIEAVSPLEAARLCKGTPRLTESDISVLETWEEFIYGINFYQKKEDDVTLVLAAGDWSMEDEGDASIMISGD